MLNKLGSEYINRTMLLNKIIYDNFNVQLFNEKYDVYKVEYIGDKKFSYFEVGFFDKVDNKENFEAISYLGGSEVYILLKKIKDTEKIYNLKKIEGKNYKISKLYIEELDKKYESIKLDIVYNLLFNSLGRNSESKEGFSYTSGNIYIYVPLNNVSRNQHIAMTVKVKNGKILRNQVSFVEFNENNIKHKNKTKYSFILGPGNTFLIKKYLGKGKAYVKSGYKKNKVIIPVDDYHLNNYKNTKVKIYDKFSKYFNFKFKDFAKLEYKKINVKTKEIENFKKTKEKKQKDINLLKNINYVKLENPLLAKEIENEQQFLEELKLIYSSNIQVSKDLKKDSLNIVLIHDSQYYKKNSKLDIKAKLNKNIISQCVTIETIANKRKDSLKSLSMHILNELYLKNELYKRKIESWNFKETEFYIGIRNKIDKEYKEYHCLMHIYKDGIFNITSNIEKIDKYKFRKYLNELRTQGNVCIVKQGKNYNKIEHTDYMPMIDYSKVECLNRHSKIKGNTTTRIKDKEALKDGLVYPYYGKSIMEIDNYIHYCVGESTGGLKYEQKTMCNIYKIVPIGNSKINYEILDMLENVHVRGNSGESVRPYPFKYMMEYIRINNPGILFSI